MPRKDTGEKIGEFCAKKKETLMPTNHGKINT